MTEPGPEDPAEEEKRASRWDWFDGACDDWSCDGCDGCGDGCSVCDGCNLLRLSTVLLAIGAVRPPSGVVLAGLAFYRRRLTRFTPRCPSTPSCSAYAVDAVRNLGARRGLVAAARRVRACAPPSG